METTREYFLLLIDVRGSTKMAPARLGRVMERLGTELPRINRRLGKNLVLGLKVSYGDEVAGLFATASRLYDAVAAVRDTLHPDARLRFVVVRGRVAIASRDIRKVGGPAFKLADDAMERLKKQRGYARWHVGDPLADAVLNSLAGMSNALLEGMTAYKRTVYGLMSQGVSRKDAARRLRKYLQSVSTAARTGKADEVLEAEATIRAVLTRLDKRKTVDSVISITND